MRKVVPVLGHSAVNTELIILTFHHCPGNSQKENSKWRIGKVSHICMTPAEVLLASISPAVAGFNRPLHAPSGSPGGFWMGEGPNLPAEALHIIP